MKKYVKNILILTFVVFFIGSIAYALFSDDTASQEVLHSIIVTILWVIFAIVMLIALGCFIYFYSKRSTAGPGGTALPMDMTWVKGGLKWFFKEFKYPIGLGIAFLCIYLTIVGIGLLHDPVMETQQKWAKDPIMNPFKGNGTYTSQDSAKNAHIDYANETERIKTLNRQKVIDGILFGTGQSSNQTSTPESNSSALLPAGNGSDAPSPKAKTVEMTPEQLDQLMQNSGNNFSTGSGDQSPSTVTLH